MSSDTFVSQLYNKLHMCQVPWTILNDNIKTILLENNLEIRSKAIPKEAIERSINPVSKRRTYELNFRSLEFPNRLQQVKFFSEGLMTAYMTGLGANPKVYDIEICYID